MLVLRNYVIYEIIFGVTSILTSPLRSHLLSGAQKNLHTDDLSLGIVPLHRINDLHN